MKKADPKTFFPMVIGLFTGAVFFLIMGMGIFKEGVMHNSFLVIGAALLIATLILNKSYMNSTKEDKRDGR